MLRRACPRDGSEVPDGRNVKPSRVWTMLGRLLSGARHELRWNDRRQDHDTHQHARPGAVRQPDRHHHRVLRLLHLRDGGGAGLSDAVLSGVGSGVGDARLAGDVRDRLSRPPDRLGAVRALRRSRRPQDDAGRGAADDGGVDGGDRRCCRRTRRSASPRRCCSRCAASGRASASAASGAVRCCSRSRTRRRASAPGTACSRSSARRSASSSPAASSCCCRASLDDEQFFALRLADSVPRQRGAGARRSLRAADDHRDAGVPRDASTRSERVKVPMVAVFRDHSGHAGRSASWSSLATFVLFYLMTVFALSWGTTALGYSPRDVPADAAVRHSLLRADDPARRRCSPSAAAAAR